jgi:hypothetical protein
LLSLRTALAVALAIALAVSGNSAFKATAFKARSDATYRVNIKATKVENNAAKSFVEAVEKILTVTVIDRWHCVHMVQYMVYSYHVCVIYDNQ